MSSFDFELNSFPEGFDEIEEGVYFKHYGINMRDYDALRDKTESDSFGCFEDKTLLWQKEISMNCNCIAMKSIIDGSLGDTEIKQNRIMEECIERGLFQKHCGSSFDDFLEMLKINFSNQAEKTMMVDVVSNSGLQELAQSVESDEEIICYVNMMFLDYDGDSDFIGLNSDGLVHVIGITFSDSNGDYVIINDVEKDNGAGRKIALDRFIKSWSTSNYTAITVDWR